ncbi:hypothetical protein OAJ94_05315, partial [Deltaproteobacteria bacterium]|nr:hypothetical protein [Deltaproteobacteria bacterium]
PFCDTENPLDADSCYQCYYELNKKAMNQSSASSDTSNDSLWGELMREVIPGAEDELVMEAMSMDEMTYEIDEYDTVGDDEVIIMSEDGPSFEEILDSAQFTEERTDEVLMSLATPSIAEITAIQVDEIELPSSIPESSVPAAMVPPSLPSTNILSEDSLDDDLDEIIAAATAAAPVPAPVPPALPATPALAPVQAPAPLPVPTPVPTIPSIPPPPAAFQIPTPAVAVPTTVVPVPAIPSLTQVNGASAPSSPASSLQPVVPQVNGAIWPWPQAELWDQRDLRRGIIEAMELAGRGDAASALATLDRIGPHLGESMEALHHIGVLLHTLGRREEMRKMVNAAVATYPSDPNVSTAAAALLQS